MKQVNYIMMPYLGRYARVTLVREITWELLRQDNEWATKPFTMKDFLERHGKKLENMLGKMRPDIDIERAVKGALRSLEKKGLVESTKRWQDTVYTKNIYFVNKSLVPYSYGRALIEAQRIRFL
jgi:hypothetical protein